ncbi:TPA: hypothetical protein R4E87_002157 [Salmonella enterica subsp. enterica serovar Orientalis]|nr:hypothetical protein [Salmonella enterica subsp. enterica serovar Orientalis]
MKTELHTVPTSFRDDNMRAISCYKSVVFNESMPEGALIARLVELDIHKDNKETVEKFQKYTGYDFPFADVTDNEIKAMIAKIDDFAGHVSTMQEEHKKNIDAMNDEACRVIRESDNYDKALGGVREVLVKRHNTDNAFLYEMCTKEKILSSFGLIFGIIERTGKSVKDYVGEGNVIPALPFNEKLLSNIGASQHKPLKATYDMYKDYYQAVAYVVAYFDKYQDDPKMLDIVKAYYSTDGEALRNSLSIDEFIKKSQEIDERQNELNRLINMKA